MRTVWKRVQSEVKRERGGIGKISRVLAIVTKTFLDFLFSNIMAQKMIMSFGV